MCETLYRAQWTEQPTSMQKAMGLSTEDKYHLVTDAVTSSGEFPACKHWFNFISLA